MNHFGVFILSRKAGINQITPHFVIFGQTPVIEKLVVIFDDKWNQIISQTFFKNDQSANTPVSILKWMYFFEMEMKINNIVYCNFLPGMISINQIFHVGGYILRKRSFGSSNNIGFQLVLTNPKP